MSPVVRVPCRLPLRLSREATVGRSHGREPVVYKKSDGKYWLADNVDATQGAVAGIAMTPNIADGYGIIATGGKVDLGATLAVGQTYSQASTAGKIELESDVASGEFKSDLGIATTAALLDLNINNSGIAHA